MKNEYMERLENLEKKEEALYETKCTWRESLGRTGWVDISGVWRRTSLGYDFGSGTYGTPTQEMSESEILFSDMFYEISDFIQEEKKRVLQNYLETFK